jgi:DNA-binding MarR family transcriptional regulator
MIYTGSKSEKGAHMPSAKQPDHVGGVGLLLERVAASIAKEFEESTAPWKLRALHLGILSTIERFGPLPQIRIGEYLGIERQSMANLVDDLEKMAFVERTKDPSDRRVWAVTITAAGRAANDEAAAAGAIRGRTIFARLTKGEQAVLAELLTKLASGGKYPHLFVAPV